MPELQTPRLLLRDITPADEPAVQRYAGDPQVCRFTDWGPNTPQQTRLFLDAVVTQGLDPDRTGWTFGITTRDPELVGACAVEVTSRQHHRGSMGYVLAQAHWGQGYATEAARAVLGFAVHDLGLVRVEATCRPENHASRRVLEKIGMVAEGVLRSHVLVRGERQDSLLFAAVR